MEKIYIETATVGQPQLDKQSPCHGFTGALSNFARHRMRPFQAGTQKHRFQGQRVRGLVETWEEVTVLAAPQWREEPG